MLTTILAGFYERDIRKMIEEVKLFKHETDLWRVQGSIKNSAGNLVLHIIGGTNHFFGATLAKTGYVRNRELEFSKKDTAKEELIAELEALVPLVTNTLIALTPEKLDADYPLLFDGMKRSTAYILVQLLGHLDYHLGQVNYIRRMFE
jgi:hypothetical protein